MAEGSDEIGGSLPMLTPEKDPANYTRREPKIRFAIAKYYGFGSDGEWTVSEIADELDVTPRTVYRYLNESSMAREVKEVLAVTEAEWRLDMAVQLRREVKRLEQIESELLTAKKAVATEYEEQTVHGTPTGDRNIRIDEDRNMSSEIRVPMPSEFDTVTDYSDALERVQKEKRQYLSQIADLLGLNAAERKEVDYNLAERREEVKVLEVRNADTDDYPEAEVIDAEATTVEFDDG